MKKIISMLIMVVAIIVVGVVSKVTVSANQVVSDSKDGENQKEGYCVETSSFYIQFEKLSYIVYCKGHNVPHKLVYTVNGGEEITDKLRSDGQHVFCGIPEFIVYYYEFPNVKEGDIIEYEYSYTYKYGGFPEERVTSGTLVVE